MNTHAEELHRLRRENAQLREELAAWRAFEAGNAQTDGEEQQIACARKAFQIERAAARLLIFLLGRPGRLTTYDMAARHLALSDDIDGPNIVRVYVCRLRRRLPPGTIETVWGRGYTLKPQAVAPIDAAIAAVEDVSGILDRRSSQ